MSELLTRIDRGRARLALVKASVAFLKQWERDGGSGTREGRQALRAVFQYESPVLLERAIRAWIDPLSDGRLVPHAERHKRCA